MQEVNQTPDSNMSDSPELGDSSPISVRKSSELPTAAWLIFAISAVVGVLSVTVVRNFSGSVKTDEALLEELQSKIEGGRAELNRQRVESGYAPLEGQAESVEGIVVRLKKDADSLVSLVNQFQGMLAEKENRILEKNTELLRSEESRQDLAKAYSRAQESLGTQTNGRSEVERLRGDLTQLQGQNSVLTNELQDLRQQSSIAKPGVPQEEFDELKRRFDETLQAKEFFEQQVNELGLDSGPKEMPAD